MTDELLLARSVNHEIHVQGRPGEPIGSHREPAAERVTPPPLLEKRP
jgi:hypothetical protein